MLRTRCETRIIENGDESNSYSVLFRVEGHASACRPSFQRKTCSFSHLERGHTRGRRCAGTTFDAAGTFEMRASSPHQRAERLFGFGRPADAQQAVDLAHQTWAVRARDLLLDTQQLRRMYREFGEVHTERQARHRNVARHLTTHGDGLARLVCSADGARDQLQHCWM